MFFSRDSKGGEILSGMTVIVMESNGSFWKYSLKVYNCVQLIVLLRVLFGNTFRSKWQDPWKNHNLEQKTPNIKFLILKIPLSLQRIIIVWKKPYGSY